MRDHKIVALDDATTVEVSELTAAHVLKILPILSGSLNADGDIGLMELVESKWHELLPLISDCIQWPENEIELGFGDMEKIALAFYEVNQPFFNRAGQLLGIDTDKLIGIWAGKQTTLDSGVSS